MLCHLQTFCWSSTKPSRQSFAPGGADVSNKRGTSARLVVWSTRLLWWVFNKKQAELQPFGSLFNNTYLRLSERLSLLQNSEVQYSPLEHHHRLRVAGNGTMPVRKYLPNYSHQLRYINRSILNSSFKNSDFKIFQSHTSSANQQKHLLILYIKKNKSLTVNCLSLIRCSKLICCDLHSLYVLSSTIQFCECNAIILN